MTDTLLHVDAIRARLAPFTHYCSLKPAVLQSVEAVANEVYRQFHAGWINILKTTRKHLRLSCPMKLLSVLSDANGSRTFTMASTKWYIRLYHLTDKIATYFQLVKSIITHLSK